MTQYRLRADSAQATQEFGRHLASLLFPGAVVLLSGNLGAGKTALTQGIGAGLGVSEPITSPTFTIVQEYASGRLPLIHADLYRIGDPSELAELGFEEYFERGGVVVIEWPDQLGELRPPEYLELRLDYLGPAERRITVAAHGSAYARLAEELVGGGPLPVESTSI